MFGKSQKNQSQPASTSQAELDDPLVNFNSTFGFSGTSLDDLQATEYTLIGIAVDDSFSVKNFAKDMEDCLKTVVQSLADCPRSDNLMLRTIKFSGRTEEVHGFKELTKCDLDNYNGVPQGLGRYTSLYDATVDIVESLNEYGKELAESNWEGSVNAVVYVITDGEDNHSTYNPSIVVKKLKEGIGEKKLQSLTSILVGVNVENPRINKYLQDYKEEADFSAYIPIEEASKDALSKLAGFTVKSVLSVSKKLNNPNTSVNLTF